MKKFVIQDKNTLNYLGYGDRYVTLGEAYQYDTVEEALVDMPLEGDSTYKTDQIVELFIILSPGKALTRRN